jgi:hypothetical protein
MNVLFTDLEKTIFGFTLTRYELNAILGLLASGGVFTLTAFFNRREGTFKERIESLETDLATPAHADVDDRVRPEGLKAYKLMGILAVILGAFLIILFFFTIGENGWLNGFTGLIAIGIGVLILTTVRRYARTHCPEFFTSNHRKNP